MKILVCGGRDYNDFARFWEVMDRLARKYGFVHIISGGAKGADRMAEAWARDRAAMLSIYRADWSKLGRAAGPIRNQKMIDEGKPSLVVAFPGGAGTADMVSRAEKAGIEVLRVDHDRAGQG